MEYDRLQRGAHSFLKELIPNEMGKKNKNKRYPPPPHPLLPVKFALNSTVSVTVERPKSSFKTTCITATYELLSKVKDTVNAKIRR